LVLNRTAGPFHLWQFQDFIVIFSYSILGKHDNRVLLMNYKNEPWRWPLNLVTQDYTGAHKRKPEELKIYLLGNPFVWWLNLLPLLFFPCLLLRRLFDLQRASGFNIEKEPMSELMSSACWLYLGWSIHYLPFFFMSRALFIHHYFPAMIFSTCLTGVLLDLALKELNHKVRLAVLASAGALLIFCFRLFSQLVNGFRGEVSNLESSSIYHLRWLDSWFL